MSHVYKLGLHGEDVNHRGAAVSATVVSMIGGGWGRGAKE